ncbi:hypothetical protein Pelo_18987 [Pelomyxa schiedti]|nr:hypothetical protein Pelo_18987 [Pelomyxa schiedti]
MNVAFEEGEDTLSREFGGSRFIPVSQYCQYTGRCSTKGSSYQYCSLSKNEWGSALCIHGEGYNFNTELKTSEGRISKKTKLPMTACFIFAWQTTGFTSSHNIQTAIIVWMMLKLWGRCTKRYNQLPSQILMPKHNSHALEMNRCGEVTSRRCSSTKYKLPANMLGP